MSANKNGNQPLKRSVKRMQRPERMNSIVNGKFKVQAFFARAEIRVGA